MPDGGAVENGALLSVSELKKRGYFVNSPSDDVPVGPILSNQNKDDNKKDKTYQPLKHSSTLDDDAPEQIYGSDGEELISETEGTLLDYLPQQYPPGSLACHQSSVLFSTNSPKISLLVLCFTPDHSVSPPLDSAAPSSGHPPWTKTRTRVKPTPKVFLTHKLGPQLYPYVAPSHVWKLMPY